MSELIADEIVEALGRRRYEDMVRLDKYPENWPAWEDFHGDLKERVTEGVRADLETVAPLIAARALEVAADDWQRGEWADAPRRFDPAQERIATAQHVTEWLRARAASEERGK
ncbi:hypothetical protein GCM10027059_26020 [Myceligenerans halotolerans]